nr:MAG TPA: hypothetical protein [Caudoviricetes sp.]
MKKRRNNPLQHYISLASDNPGLFLYLLNNITHQNKIFPIAKHKPFEQFTVFRIKVQKKSENFSPNSCIMCRTCTPLSQMLVMAQATDTIGNTFLLELRD